MKTKDRKDLDNTIPLNRRIYAAFTGAVAQLVKGPLLMLSLLKVPAAMAALFTLLASVGSPEPLSHFMTRAGATELAGLFILYLAFASAICLVLLVLRAVLGAVFR